MALTLGSLAGFECLFFDNLTVALERAMCTK